MPGAEDGRGAGEARTAPDAPSPHGPQGGRFRVTWLLKRAAQQAALLLIALFSTLQPSLPPETRTPKLEQHNT